MDYNLIELAPHYLRDVLEYSAILRAEQRLLGDIGVNLLEAQNNKNILKLNESGVRIWEEIFGILPNPASETLDFRRERILNRLLTKPPFTEGFLRERLNEILGEGNYNLTVDGNTYTILLETVMESQAWVQELYITMGKVKPANMVYINKASVQTNLRISEEVSYNRNFWNYRLGTWKLSSTVPFEDKSFGGIIKMANEPSLTNRGIGYALQGVDTKISKARINGSLLVDLTNKEIIDNQLIVEFKVLETVAPTITKIELLDTTDQVVSGTTTEVYVQVIDDVDIKSVFTLKQGV